MSTYVRYTIDIIRGYGVLGMIMCFNCSRQAKSCLDQLVSAGQYADYAEILNVAVQNLAALHREFGDKTAIVMQRGSADGACAVPAPGGAVEAGNVPHEPEAAAGHTSIPAIFTLPDEKTRPKKLAPLPDDVFSVRHEVPLERWLFGQYNKMLPAKATCRALIRLLADSPAGIPIDAAGAAIAEEAARLGDILAEHDQRHELRRRDGLATGFPSTGPNSDKSRLRYASQFVGAVNASGQLSGLPFGLKLVNGTGPRSARLLLTKAGLQFALMPNPVLDGPRSQPNERFSDDEIDFLVGHIRSSVPVEDLAYQSILRTILSGASTPKSVDEALRVLVSEDAAQSVTEGYLSSQRSGAVSRMVDLGLVTRAPDGTRVSYLVTERARKYFPQID